MSKDHNTVLPSEEKAFYGKGRDWEADRKATIEKSERRAWMVAGVASVIAISAVIGMATLAPFKRVVPYVFTVEKSTGNVELVSAADDRTIVGYQELLDKHWATRYVNARESYFYRLLQNDYDTVVGLSSDQVGREYAKLYDGVNARDKKYGAGTELTVKVLSVTLARDNVGAKTVVRFEKTSRRADSDLTEPPQYFVATMAYEYKPSMFGKERDLIKNPLGYRVTSYRVDSELAPVGPAAK